MAGMASFRRLDQAHRRRKSGWIPGLATVAAVGLVFVLGRCAAGPGPAAAPADPPDLRAQVARTIAARVRAVQDHDKAAYLATDADGAWRTEDATRFDSLQAVPFAAWGLSLTADYTGSPAPVQGEAVL